MITERVTEDTIKLLKECDAGVKMAIESFDEVLDAVENSELKKMIKESKNMHQKIGTEIDLLLSKIKEDGKEPSPMAKAMSWTKINMKIMADKTDKTIADLMTDGCNMGIKTLTKYKNEYAEANKKAVNITDRLIIIEKELGNHLKKYL